MNPDRLHPIFPLDANIEKLRGSIQERIETAPPAIVQAIYVILEQNFNDRFIRDLYKASQL